jgi:hypothetical protein
MNCSRSRIILMSLATVATILGSCSSTPADSRNTSARGSFAVPHEWKSYSYGKARISIPSDWSAVTNYICADSASVGTLYLGPPKEPYASCPSEVSLGDSVTITPLPVGAVDQPQCSFKMNGIRVNFGPCTSSNAAGIIFYDIPALGIRAEGAGTKDQNVTGPGTGTVVGRVLHTIRRRLETKSLGDSGSLA